MQHGRERPAAARAWPDGAAAATARILFKGAPPAHTRPTSCVAGLSPALVRPSCYAMGFKRVKYLETAPLVPLENVPRYYRVVTRVLGSRADTVVTSMSG